MQMHPAPGKNEALIKWKWQYSYVKVKPVKTEFLLHNIYRIFDDIGTNIKMQEAKLRLR